MSQGCIARERSIFAGAAVLAPDWHPQLPAPFFFTDNQPANRYELTREFLLTLVAKLTGAPRLPQR